MKSENANAPKERGAEQRKREEKVQFERISRPELLAGALKKFSLESAISELPPPKKTRTKGRKKLQHFQNGGFIARVFV